MERGVASQVLPSYRATRGWRRRGRICGEADGRLSETRVRDAGKQVGSHPGQGNNAFLLAALLAWVCVGLYVHEAYGERIRERFGIADRYRLPFDENLALYAVAVPIAVAAAVMMVIAGHSGATLVWKTAGVVTPPAGG